MKKTKPRRKFSCSDYWEDATRPGGVKRSVLLKESTGKILNHPVFSQDIHSSGLSGAIIQNAKLQIVSREEATEYLGFDPGSECLAFPYHSTDGYMQLKPAKPLIIKGKPAKYLVSKGSVNHLYIPRPALLPAEILKDPTQPLIVTEGSKKVLKAIQEGFYAIGMPGVWCWRTRDGDKSKPVDEFKLIVWQNRVIYILFDSDALDNPNVKAAEEQLFDHIRKIGGYPLIARIPKPQGGDWDKYHGKYGLDDFLTSIGAKALKEVLRKAKPLPKSFFVVKNFRPPLLSRELQRRNIYVKCVDRSVGEGQVYLYKNGVYQKAGDISKEAQDLLGIYSTKPRVKEAIFHIENAVSKFGILMNLHNLIINCHNGLLDVLSGKIDPHTPEYLSSIQIPVNWNPEVECGRLDSFLQEILPLDCIEFVEEIIGYLMIPDLRFKKLFILLGPSDNGKTTFLSLLRSLLGMWNCSEIPLQDFSTNRFAASGLEDKLLNVFDDLSTEALKNTGLIKMLTGNQDGTIEIEKKHKSRYRVRLTAKMMFSTNEMPRAFDYTPAWYERLVILPFVNTFRGGSADHQLLSKITTPDALQRLFYRGVVGAQRLYKRGCFKMPKTVKQELHQYKTSNDNVMSFVEECCTLGGEEQIKRTFLYDRYRDYCEDSGFRSVSRQNFYKRLTTGVGNIGEKTIHGYPHLTGIGRTTEDLVVDVEDIRQRAKKLAQTPPFSKVS